MNGPLLWRLLLAHFAADFALQPDALIIAKRRVWGVAIHAAIVWVALAITLRDYIGSRTILIAMGALTIFHFAVDVGKTQLQKRAGRESLWLFLGDQGLHIASMFLIAYLLRFRVIRIMPAALPLTLAIVAIWGGPILFELIRAEATGRHLAAGATLGARRGRLLSLVEGSVLFAIGLQFGWFLFGLVVLVPRIVGWFKGRAVGIVPYCWGFAFGLGLVARFIILKG